MLEIGKWQSLTVVRRKDFGIYLGEDQNAEETVLLPRKQVPESLKIGDTIDVFLYRDSMDRKIATVHQPKLVAGEIAKLKVVSVGAIGAFMDCGLERDVLLPFKEQTTRVSVGEEYPVYMYVDKSERLCVTMYLYPHLHLDPPYQKGDPFVGTVYEYKEHMGAFVAVENRYSGLIPKSELFQRIRVGDVVQGRVLNVREDGKMDLSIRRLAYQQMDIDGDKILENIRQRGGVLPFTDKASPDIIRAEFEMSKNEFKRAVGGLLKKGLIEITGTQIRICETSVKESLPIRNEIKKKTEKRRKEL